MPPLIVPIHGLPFTGIEAPVEHQMGALLRTWRAKQYTVWDDYNWAGNSNLSALRLLHRELEYDKGEIRNSFIIDRSLDFGEWFGRKLVQFTSQTDFVTVVAYSAGGAIFYRWLCHVATKDEAHRIALAIVVAAPYAFPETIRLPGRAQSFAVDEPATPADEILKKLVAYRVDLKVLQAQNDDLIPPAVGIGLFDEKHGVDQVIIPEVQHDTILASDDVQFRINKWIDALTTAAM